MKYEIGDKFEFRDFPSEIYIITSIDYDSDEYSLQTDITSGVKFTLTEYELDRDFRKI